MADVIEEHLYDFSNMPLTPAQETVELLKQILAVLQAQAQPTAASLAAPKLPFSKARGK